MGQERFPTLSLLHIESDLTDKLKAEQIIDTYDAKAYDAACYCIKVRQLLIINLNTSFYSLWIQNHGQQPCARKQG